MFERDFKNFIVINFTYTETEVLLFTHLNYIYDADPRLRLSFAKDIRFMELDGSPGLTYRKGKTDHSYRWMPITVNSPISSRTRFKTKKLTNS